MYGFTLKILMLILAKALPKVFLKQLIHIYKAFVYLSSPANRSIQLWVKHKLEIQGIWKNAKHIPNLMIFEFWANHCLFVHAYTNEWS